jgi:hypothetical protein
MGESREFGASGHCLIFLQLRLIFSPTTLFHFS